MIEFKRFVLGNGLRVVVHEDDSTPMAVVNVLYDVGSKDEPLEKTGYAHLFEHLMFEGTKQVPDFDAPLQHAGGENNAFTNVDFTNYYDVVPAENLEVALWLEADRMQHLKLTQKNLHTQRKVVVEEFKETCLNQPYGDVWHHLFGLAYAVHPYKTPTIGASLEHIQQITLEDVKHFYNAYYTPANAILTVAGNVKAKEVQSLVEKWFGSIASAPILERNLPIEPPQNNYRFKEIRSNAPVEAIYMAFQSPARLESDYYTSDLLSDILSYGRSSRLYRHLLKEKALFSEIDCYVSGNIDAGLLIVEGKLNKGVSLEIAETAIWDELFALCAHAIPERELQKYQNRAESTLLFGEASALTKANNLALCELLGDPDLINQEAAAYKAITTDDLRRTASRIFRKENASVLRYRLA